MPNALKVGANAALQTLLTGRDPLAAAAAAAPAPAPVIVNQGVSEWWRVGFFLVLTGWGIDLAVRSHRKEMRQRRRRRSYGKMKF